MGYSEIDDLKKLIDESNLISLTDDEGNGTINEDRVNEAIDIADREIDAYCGGRYSVPFSEVPEIIRNISAQMAVYHLFSRRPDDAPQIWKDKYSNCLKLLEKIQTGEIVFQIGTTSSNQSVRYIKKTRYFTNESLKNY